MKRLYSSAMAMIIGIAVLSIPLNAAAKDKPWLGVSVDDLPFEQLAEYKLDHGVSIKKVFKDTAAEKAGLEQEDILLQIDQQPVYSTERLQWLVATKTAGDSVTVTYMRNNKRNTVKTTLTKMQMNAHPSAHGWSHKERHGEGKHHGKGGHHNKEHHGEGSHHGKGAHHKKGHPGRGAQNMGGSHLGVNLQYLNDGLREYFGAPTDAGMLITEVEEDSAAAKAGLLVGDVIVKMGPKAIRHMGDIRRVMSFYDPGEQIIVNIVRDKKNSSLNVTLHESKRSSRQWSSPQGMHNSHPRSQMQEFNHHPSMQSPHHQMPRHP